MKSLFAGIVLIVVVGLAGFFYRNTLEHPPVSTGTACTLEAKICPDGTTVGRTGASCAFAPCTAPNVSLDAIGIGFALPDGYTALSPLPSGDASLIAAYVSSTASSTQTDEITIRQFQIPEGSTTDAVILANTKLEPSDKSPKDMNAFTPAIIGTRTFSKITLEQFEGTVESAYFLPRTNDVLEFEIIEHGVKNWTSPSLIPANLPAHQALIKMLGTLEVY